MNPAMDAMVRLLVRWYHLSTEGAVEAVGELRDVRSLRRLTEPRCTRSAAPSAAQQALSGSVLGRGRVCPPLARAITTV